MKDNRIETPAERGIHEGLRYQTSRDSDKPRNPPAIGKLLRASEAPKRLECGRFIAALGRVEAVAVPKGSGRQKGQFQSPLLSCLHFSGIVGISVSVSFGTPGLRWSVRWSTKATSAHGSLP